MMFKAIHDLTYHLYPGKAQRQLRLIPTRTLKISFANEFALDIHSHIGTHIEGPYHCLEDGKKLDELPVEKFVGEAAVVDLTRNITGNRKITKRDLLASGTHIREGDIVLLKTGYDKQFKNEQLQSEEYMSNSPYLSDEAVDWLIEKRIKNMGIDFWSIEKYPIDPKIGEPKHIRLFKEDIPFIHSLVNLIDIKSPRVFFIALPLLISGLDSSPVRAIAIEF
jgi:arylformamidase